MASTSPSLVQISTQEDIDTAVAFFANQIANYYSDYKTNCNSHFLYKTCQSTLEKIEATLKKAQELNFPTQELNNQRSIVSSLTNEVGFRVEIINQKAADIEATFQALIDRIETIKAAIFEDDTASLKDAILGIEKQLKTLTIESIETNLPNTNTTAVLNENNWNSIFANSSIIKTTFAEAQSKAQAALNLLTAIPDSTETPESIYCDIINYLLVIEMSLEEAGDGVAITTVEESLQRLKNEHLCKLLYFQEHKSEHTEAALPYIDDVLSRIEVLECTISTNPYKTNQSSFSLRRSSPVVFSDFEDENQTLKMIAQQIKDVEIQIPTIDPEILLNTLAMIEVNSLPLLFSDTTDDTVAAKLYTQSLDELARVRDLIHTHTTAGYEEIPDTVLTPLVEMLNNADATVADFVQTLLTTFTQNSLLPGLGYLASFTPRPMQFKMLLNAVVAKSKSQTLSEDFTKEPSLEKRIGLIFESATPLFNEFYGEIQDVQFTIPADGTITALLSESTTSVDALLDGLLSYMPEALLHRLSVESQSNITSQKFEIFIFLIALALEEQELVANLIPYRANVNFVYESVLNKLTH